MGEPPEGGLQFYSGNGSDGGSAGDPTPQLTSTTIKIINKVAHPTVTVPAAATSVSAATFAVTAQPRQSGAPTPF